MKNRIIMMSRLLAGLLSASLAMSFCGSTVSAAVVQTEKPIHIYVEEVTAYPGDQNVEIRVFGENTENVKSGGLQIYHEPEVKPVFAENSEVKILVTTNKATFESTAVYNPKYNLIAVLADSGFLSYTCYFDIPQGIKPGRYPVTVTVDSLIDKEANKLSYVSENGFIEVLSNLRGDVNCDGIVSREDADLAMQEYSTLSTNHPSILTEQGRINGDVDGDGCVTASDASMILYRVSNGVFPDEAESTSGTTGTTSAPTTTANSSSAPNYTSGTRTQPPTETTVSTADSSSMPSVVTATSQETTTTTTTTTTSTTTTTTTTTSTTKRATATTPETTTTKRMTTTTTRKTTTTTTGTTTTTKKTTTTKPKTTTTTPVTTTTTTAVVTTTITEEPVKKTYTHVLTPGESKSFEAPDDSTIQDVTISDREVAVTALSEDGRKITIRCLQSGTCRIVVTLSNGDRYAFAVSVSITPGTSGTQNSDSVTTTTTTTTQKTTATTPGTTITQKTASTSTTISTVTTTTTTVITTTTTALPAKPYMRGYDDWGFVNKRKILGEQNEKTRTYQYKIDDADREALLAKLSNSEAARIREELNKRPSGSCYGMSATSLLQYYGIFSPDMLVDGVSSLAEITEHNLNDRTCSVINYYQLLQFTKPITQLTRKTEQMSDAKKIQELTDLLKSGKPVLLGYIYDGPEKERFAHAVVAYGIKTNQHGILPITDTERFQYDTEILIYDNLTLSDSKAYNMFINTKTNVWCIPSASDENEYNKLAIMNLSSHRDGVISLICADPELLNSSGLFSGSTVPAVDYTRACMTIVPFKSAATFGSIHAASDGTFYGDGDDGDIQFTASFLGDEEQAEIKAVMDSDLGYYVAAAKPDSMHVSMEYEFCLLHADADTAKKVSVSPDACIECRESSGSYLLSMVLDEGHHATDWHTISVSGKDGGTVRLQAVPKQNGWIVQGDSLSHVTVQAQGSKSSAEVSFSSTKYDKALIYQIDENTIGIAVDSDRDGKFETTIAKTGDTPEYMQGDADGSGEVDVTDAQLVLSAYCEAIAGNPNPLNDAQQKAADVDGNQEVDVKDAQYILTFYVQNHVSGIPTDWSQIISQD